MTANASDLLLSVNNLRTSFRVGPQYYAAVDDVSLDIRKNEVLAIVGESGSGKSAFALSIPRLHNMNYTQIEGEINFEGKNILSLNEGELNKIRGDRISMIFQDPLIALNPLLRVGGQIEENLTYHTKLNDAEKKQRAIELLSEVGMVNPKLTHSQYPHELSGGMRQRAMIALAIACNPDLIIADEPTTALDVTIQAQILDLLRSIQKETKSSMILITHDLGVVAETADRVAVMYAGQIVEVATVYELFENPLHPYTRSLLASIPVAGNKNERLKAIKGLVPTLKYMPRTGCRFSHRTPWVDKSIHQEHPTYHEPIPGHKVLCTCYEKFHFEDETNGGA
ncbi:MAG: ABC transporter ATP-binding protein [Defluviitaleaceae bacterium]|nr:ABC transporter ATP-binding protein [Defluviitaleaceae bacterium]